MRIAIGLTVCLAGAALGLVDDRAITVKRPGDLAPKRQELIRFIWGNGGFPKALPAAVQRNAASPVTGLAEAARVDQLRIDMDGGQSGLAYHLIPAKPNRKLVVLHHGHACTFDDEDRTDPEKGYGMARLTRALLKGGYSVLTVYMPHMKPGDCRTVQHPAMFSLKTEGSPMKYFLEPVAVSLNYVEKRAKAEGFPAYKEFHMVGLSGGGWTTTVYAAIDPRIRLSFPVAGAIPLYLRYRGSVGDLEQFLDAFYSKAGYPDLFVLGASGKGRGQVQILNRKDDCCFGEAQHDAATSGKSYEAAMRGVAEQVQGVVGQMGGGAFRLEIDESAPSHMISRQAGVKIIIPELERYRP
jgi:pimeloyl-ACP methyl ester carboxylesterase